MRTSSTYGFIRRIGAFASSTSQVTCAWGCSARIRQGRSCRFPVYNESRVRSALPQVSEDRFSTVAVFLTGRHVGRGRPWTARTDPPRCRGQRPTRNPVQDSSGRSPLPPRTWVRSTETWAASPWPMARDQATCRAYTLRRPTGRHRRRRGSTTGLFHARPAVSGQLALAPPRRQVPCTAETRAAQPGTRTDSQTCGGLRELLLCGAGGFPSEEVEAYVREFTSGFRPFAPDGRPWTRSPDSRSDATRRRPSGATNSYSPALQATITPGSGTTPTPPLNYRPLPATSEAIPRRTRAGAFLRPPTVTHDKGNEQSNEETLRHSERRRRVRPPRPPVGYRQRERRSGRCAVPGCLLRSPVARGQLPPHGRQPWRNANSGRTSGWHEPPPRLRR